MLRVYWLEAFLNYWHRQINHNILKRKVPALQEFTGTKIPVSSFCWPHGPWLWSSPKGSFPRRYWKSRWTAWGEGWGESREAQNHPDEWREQKGSCEERRVRRWRCGEGHSTGSEDTRWHPSFLTSPFLPAFQLQMTSILKFSQQLKRTTNTDCS